ncbi:MAG: polyprenyl synthetase family protein [Microbacteriaceae bacterium]|nr:polyprenyl synthetase family protein [Microbacteriaceae bacterium]MBT5730589.1 polyprenyl synthetase family protein [Microbacteriaceae bacterium]
MAGALDQGLVDVESGLERELKFSEDIADAVARYLFSAGGKRVRPLLTLLTSQWGEGINERVIRAAQVIELTHLATLYHDDVMDEAAQRRGVDATQTVWGNSVAILAGDLLFARAGSLVASQGQQAITLQAATFERLCLGQMRETVGPKEGQDPIEHYLSVLSDKTGSLIALSAEMGIRMSGGSEDLVPPLRRFGEKVGIAFQLVDDVIDLSDRGAGTGKPPGTDVRRGVTTLPMLYLEQRASSDAEAAELLGRLHLGTQGEATEEQFHQAIQDLREHDVTAATMAKARDMADDAIAELSPVPAGIVRDALTRFAHQIVERSY